VNLLAKLESKNFILTIVLFFVLMFGLVINPVWIVPKFSYGVQVNILIFILILIVGSSLAFYFLISRNQRAATDHSDHFDHISEKSHHKTIASDGASESFTIKSWLMKSWKTVIPFIVILAVFIIINAPYLLNGIQNCGDENNIVIVGLKQEEIIKLFFSTQNVTGYLLFLCTAIIAISSIILCILGLNKLLKKHKTLDQNKHHVLKKYSLLALFSSLLIFCIIVLSVELTNPDIKTLLLSGESQITSQQSPFSLWFKAPLLLISPNNPDILLRTITMVYSIATLILIYWFFNKYYSNKWIAVSASAIYAFSMLFLVSTTSIMLTNIYMSYYLFSMFIFLFFLKDRDPYLLGLSLILAIISLFFKFQGLILLPIMFLTYIFSTIKISLKDRKIHMKDSLRKILMNIGLFCIMGIVYVILKFIKKNYYDRDVIINSSTISQLFDPKFITAYPKTLVEQFTIPLIIIFIIGLLYLLVKKRDDFFILGIMSFVITIPILTIDLSHFIGADFGRYAAGVGIFIAGFAAIIIVTLFDRYAKENTKTWFMIIVILVSSAYMIKNSYGPSDFERQKYDDSMIYVYKYWPFEHPDSRFLPSKELALKMKEQGITGKRILYLRYFPQETYDKLLGLNNNYSDFTTSFFEIPTDQQNPQSLLAYVKQNNISYVILPYIESNNWKEWYYSCAFISLETGDNPVFIPQIVEQQKEFKTVFYEQNKNGKLYLLEPST
jgi:hypothetical protein